MRLLPRRLIGQTIRGIRNRLGMSQADFARSVGADSGAQVARWEKGQAQPDYSTLAKIATMGVVDVLVFHDTAAAEEMPQFTPGEANELREILLRMEALLDDARQLVDRASSRTALDALEAATGHVPASSGGAEALVLDAELRVETRPRSRTASASRRSASRTAPAAAPRKRGTPAGTGSGGKATTSNGTGASTAARGSSARSKAGSGSSRSGGRSGASRTASSGPASSGGNSGSESGSTPGSTSP